MGNILGCVFTPQELHTSTLTGRPSNRSVGKQKPYPLGSELDENVDLLEKNLNDSQCGNSEEMDPAETPKIYQLDPLKVQACRGE